MTPIAMTSQILVTLDGTVHDAAAPFLYADDLAAVRGDGVFETLLVRDGRTRRVTAHLDRMQRSLAMMDLPVAKLDAWRHAIGIAEKEWASAAGDAEGWLRLVTSRGRESDPAAGPTCFVMVGPVGDRVRQSRSDGIAVITLDRGYSLDLAGRAPWQLLGAKTLSYATNMAALRYAAQRGADDVIYLSSEGMVLEGPRSTVIVVQGKTLVTPPTEIGILPGTTQQGIFARAADAGWATEIAELRPADLRAADTVWLVSSVTLAARVTALDGRPMPGSPNDDEFVNLVDLSVSVDPE